MRPSFNWKTGGFNDMRSTPEVIYEQQIDPAACSDIGQHLPRLRREAHGDVVEIGTRGGASTSALILGVRENGGHVYSIDINEACGTDVFDPAAVPEWTFICGHSVRDRDRIFAKLPEWIDVLFIDGEHDYNSVHGDLKTYGPLVRRGGIILFHDVELEGSGVLRTMEEYVGENFLRMTIDHGCYGLGCIRA
jgi:predicted O-methyltransferase YrrM